MPRRSMSLVLATQLHLLLGPDSSNAMDNLALGRKKPPESIGHWRQSPKRESRRTPRFGSGVFSNSGKTGGKLERRGQRGFNGSSRWGRDSSMLAGHLALTTAAL